MLEKWIEILPKREGKAFTKIDRLCALHFGNECFLEEKNKQGNLNGRRRLTQTAIPTKFPKEIPRYCIGDARHRNAPASAMNQLKNHNKTKQSSKGSNVIECEEVTLKAPAQYEELENCNRIGKRRHHGQDDDMQNESDNPAKKLKHKQLQAINFETLVAFSVENLQLPTKHWFIKGHKKEAVCICKMVFNHGIGLSAEKNIVFQKNGPTLLVINGRPIHESHDFGLNSTNLTLESLGAILQKIDSKFKICPGLSKNEHAEKCSGLIPQETRKVRCDDCKSALKYNNLATSRQNKRKESNIRPYVFTSMRMKLAALTTSVNKMLS